ncbi:MAG: hypothetical protein PF483_14265 [Halothiobacillus sp.]|jgi:hypothetical protein|nr:hypothetical protein [Halothiobacillus sp.]
MSHRHILANAIVIALGASLLTGCGGGGGGGSTTESVNTSTVAATTTSGVASDGIIVGGTITASSLDGVTQYGTTTTGQNGAYTLTLSNKYDGKTPILLTLTAGTGANMVCDVSGGCGSVAYGGTIQLSNSSPILLHTVLPAKSNGGAVSAAITPWTDMAYQYIKAHTNQASSSADVDAANSMVNQITGVNVVDTQPVDLTKSTSSASSEQLAYAVMNSVFARSVASGSNIGAAITTLTEEFSDGKLASNEALSPANLSKDIDAQKSLISNDPGASALITNIKNTISGQTDLAPTPTSSTTLSAVGQAKQLVGQARTLGNSIAQLQSPAEAFKGNLQTADNVINNNSQALMTSVSEVVKQVVKQLQTDQVTGNKTYPALPINDAQNTQVGVANVTVQTTASGGFTIAITSSLNGGATSINLGMTSSLPLTVVSSPVSATTVSLTANGSVANSEAKVVLNSMTFNIDFTQPQTLIPTGGTKIASSAIKLATLSGNIEVDDLKDGASFKGGASITAVPLDSTAIHYTSNLYPNQAPGNLSLSHLSLNGTFSDASGNSFTAKASADLSNAAQFDAIGFLSNQKQTVYNNYTVNGQVSDPAATLKQLFLQGSAGYTIDSLDGVFNYYDTSTGVTYLSGLMQVSTTETNASFAKGTLSLYLGLALKGYPNTTAAITVNRTDLNAGNATVTLAQNGGITLTSVYNHSATADSLSVSNPSGTTLVATKTGSHPVTGVVTLADGTQLGTISQTNSLYIVRYEDGTFETLQ